MNASEHQTGSKRRLLEVKALLQDRKFPDCDGAAGEILDLQHAVFGPLDEEIAAAWEASAEEDLDPRVEADLLRDAAEAEDPLWAIEPLGTARTRLNALMRQRWSGRHLQAADHPAELRGLAWADLSKASRTMVREALLHMAMFAERSVRRGPPHQHAADTFLDGLTEIYARHTGFSLHQLRLPSAENSRFIKLAADLLAPILMRPPANLEAALAQRQKRFKRRHLQ